MPDRENVIAMAREAGTPYVNRHAQGETHFGFNEQSLLRFYALIAAQQKEADALICDNLPAPPSCNVLERSLWDVATTACADAIRARKEET